MHRLLVLSTGLKVVMDHPTIAKSLLHLLFTLWFTSTIAKTIENPRYETAYACENKLLKIECREGEVIKLIRANYGRFSITICNDQGNTDWSVNCMSTKSYEVLFRRCERQRSCSIQATTSTFGDPCVGTWKYLEAHYQCTSDQSKTTTGRPSPPWQITSQPPPVWSTISPMARAPPPPPKISAITTWSPARPTSGSAGVAGNKPTPPVATDTTVRPSPSVSTSAAVGVGIGVSPPAPPTDGQENQQKPPDADYTDQDLPTRNDKYPETEPQAPLPQSPQHDLPELEIEKKAEKGLQDEIATIPSSTSLPDNKITDDSAATHRHTPTSSSVPFSLDMQVKCWPVKARNLYWNWTSVNEHAVQPCPGGTTGLARWRCVASPGADQQPHWSPATPDLSQCRSVWLTNLESRVLEGDSLISIMSDLSQVTSSKTLYGGDMMITTKIIKKVAQKMSEDIKTFPDQRQREAIVTELLQGVVRTLSNLLHTSQHASWRDLSYREQMRVATSLLIGLEENAFLLADTVVIEKTVDPFFFKNIMLLVRVLDTRNIKTVTFPLEPATDVWTPSSDWLELPEEALLENSEGGLIRLVFVVFDRLEEILQWQPEPSYDIENQQKNLTKILNSKIISASLGKGRHIQLKQPVRLFLRHIKVENVSNPSCVFWDYTTNTWSEEGCRVEATNRTHTTCLCDHLTNFAILMDVHATHLPVNHQITLQIITYIGCIVSIICLVLAFITFQMFKALKSDRTTIHKHLCFCLLVAESLFVIGIGQTANRVLCGVVAGLLHLFFLCAFAWMFLEGFQLYVMLIEVFETEKSRLRWYYTSAYGIPLFIVAISAIVDPHSYGTESHCWLRADNFFIFSFVGPVILILLANLVFLGMAVIMMCRHGNTVSIKSKEHSRLASARTWLRGAFILVFLLGLTWTFGLLYLNQESVAVAYLFTILNSLQGFFIFVFHCIQNEKVRKEYHKYVRHQLWLPKCLRCSKSPGSSSATSSGTSGSSAVKDGRGTSLYPANSSNINSHSDGAASPHGTSKYVVQKNWNSRNCSTLSHAGKSPVLVSSSPVGSIIMARACRDSGEDSGDSDNGGGGEGLTSQSPPPSDQTQPAITRTGSIPKCPYDDEFTKNAINNATLPHFRNSQHKGNPESNSITNINFPKSASSWGPLNKPGHWKSFSRDSGHGASEQEESPHSHMIGPDEINDYRLSKQGNWKQHKASNLSMDGTIVGNLPTNMNNQPTTEMIKYMYNQYQAGGGKYHTNGKRKNGQRSTSPWNHTYTEIYDGRGQVQAHSKRLHEDDPVYEEIERSEIQVSDMSDEDGKRQSDMSRQSSRSYGDHRPLIPVYSPATDRSMSQCFEVGNHKFRKEQTPNRYLTTADYRVYHRGNDNPARSLAAVLDGETVVCHLEPSQMYPHENPYSARTMMFSPYSDS